jgi:hypothetical protein
MRGPGSIMALLCPRTQGSAARPLDGGRRSKFGAGAKLLRSQPTRAATTRCYPAPEKPLPTLWRGRYARTSSDRSNEGMRFDRLGRAS